jgi:hypothetical protein
LLLISSFLEALSSSAESSFNYGFFTIFVENDFFGLSFPGVFASCFFLNSLYCLVGFFF